MLYAHINGFAAPLPDGRVVIAGNWRAEDIIAFGMWDTRGDDPGGGYNQ